MTESNEPIRLLAPKKDRASEVLAYAFQEDPAYKHILPDENERFRSLRRLFGAVVGYCLRYGEVYTSNILMATWPAAIAAGPNRQG